ncbi:MAG: ATP synthase F1 subunit delta [Flavobacteriales bacterium]
MMHSTAATRYAISLRDLANEKGKVDECMADMALISNTIKENHELGTLLKSPIIKLDKKASILDALFGDKIGELSKGFVKIITQKGREELLGSIAERYVELVKASRNIITAQVTTAAPLTDALKAEVLGVIAKLQTGEVDLVQKIDPSIIGGFILRVGDQMIDSSVQTKFRKLRQEFTGNSFVSSLS